MKENEKNLTVAPMSDSQYDDGNIPEVDMPQDNMQDEEMPQDDMQDEEMPQDDMQDEEMPQDIIPDEVPRKDGPGGENSGK